MGRARGREESALNEARSRLGPTGNGVTPQAKFVFDALSKTMPCRWENEDIIVLDEVRISSPYSINNVSGGSQASLARLRLVLEGEMKRFSLKK